MESKKTFWLLLIVGIIILVAVGYFLSRPDDGNQAQETRTDTRELKPKFEDPNQLPERFPIDVPLEIGATVTQNYSTGKDGYFQSTRAFDSSKTSSENFKIYEDFFNNNGWTIIVRLDEPGIKALAATKGNNRMKVDIVETEGDTTPNVAITMEYK